MLNKRERRAIVDIYGLIGTIRGLAPSGYRTTTVRDYVEGMQKYKATDEIRFALKEMLAPEPDFDQIEESLQMAADALGVNRCSQAPMPWKPVAKCTVPWCDREPITKGLCLKHYTRVTRSGDPLIVRRRIRGGGKVGSFREVGPGEFVPAEGTEAGNGDGICRD